MAGKNIIKKKDFQAQQAKRLLELAQTCAEVAYANRAEEITLLDVSKACSWADYFVIASADNRSQLRAIAKEIEKKMKTCKLSLIGHSGRTSDNWVLLDYGDIVVNIFDPPTREYYQLEELWGDARDVSCDFSESLQDVGEERNCQNFYERL